MKWLAWIAGIAVVLLAAGLVYFRLAPSDPAVWHVDPVTAPDPGKGHARIVPPEAPVVAMTPEELMTRLDAIAMSEPRTTRLAGSVAEGFVTYVARSKLFGFPDYVSVKALPAESGATLAIFSRQRFGLEDMGVNRDRVTRWLAQLEREPS